MQVGLLKFNALYLLPLSWIVKAFYLCIISFQSNFMATTSKVLSDLPCLWTHYQLLITNTCGEWLKFWVLSLLTDNGASKAFLIHVILKFENAAAWEKWALENVFRFNTFGAQPQTADASYTSIIKLASLFLKITTIPGSGGTSMLLLMIVEYYIQSISIQLSFAAWRQSWKCATFITIQVIKWLNVLIF